MALVPETEKCNKQLASAKLRESFIRSIKALEGKACKILTYEKSMLDVTFAAWNPDGSEMVVLDMETPAHLKFNAAILRAQDVLSITF